MAKNFKPEFQLSQEELEKITPNELKGKTFDENQACQDVLNISYQTVEDKSKNQNPDIKATIENAISNHARIDIASPEEKNFETIEKCLLETIFETKILRHTLNVELKHKPSISSKIKVCKGHEERFKSDNPNRDKGRRENKLSQDKTIKSWKVFIDEKGFRHRDEIVSQWVHCENTPSCNSYTEEERIAVQESWEEMDSWNIDKTELFDRIDCTLVSSENGPSETRIIDGHSVNRPFWFKTQHLQCAKQKQHACDFLKEKNCILASKTCLDEKNGVCLIWEYAYKCLKRNYQEANEKTNSFGLDPNLWETTYIPNGNFPDVATKLAIFDEMQREIKNSKTGDVRGIQLFRGNIKQCTKNIAENLIYDCCENMGGLSTKLNLSQCTSDELVLVEARSKGLTHYIGVKKGEFLGLWTSRKEHIFCVFPTKLSRVFQEEARKQLNIGWGTAENPQCHGLTQEDIKNLDFTKLNLLEAFEIPKDVNSTEKIQRIEERLKKKVEEIT